MPFASWSVCSFRVVLVFLCLKLLLEQRLKPLDIEICRILRHLETQSSFQGRRELPAEEAEYGGFRHQYELTKLTSCMRFAQVLGYIAGEGLQFMVADTFFLRHGVPALAEAVERSPGAIGVSVLVT